MVEYTWKDYDLVCSECGKSYSIKLPAHYEDWEGGPAPIDDENLCQGCWEEREEAECSRRSRSRGCTEMGMEY